jgi:hypothetical protein
MNSILHHVGNTDYAPSPAIWGKSFWHNIREGVVPGFAHHTDFSGFKLSTNVNAAQAYWSMGWKLFGSDGAPVALLDEPGGGITISSDGDNEGVALGWSMPLVKIIRGGKRMAWELRFKTSTVTDTKHGLLMGLMDSTAMTATVPIAAAGTVADVNVTGFHRLEGDGDQLDVIYKADGVTQVSVDTDVLDGTVTPDGTLPSALVADTWTKVGQVFIPSGDGFGQYTLASFVNGIRLPGADKQVPSAAGTDFPNDVNLLPFFALLNATASTPGTASLAWFRFAQEI